MKNHVFSYNEFPHWLCKGQKKRSFATNLYHLGDSDIYLKAPKIFSVIGSYQPSYQRIPTFRYQ